MVVADSAPPGVVEAPPESVWVLTGVVSLAGAEVLDSAGAELGVALPDSEGIGTGTGTTVVPGVSVEPAELTGADGAGLSVD